MRKLNAGIVALLLLVLCGCTTVTRIHVPIEPGGLAPTLPDPKQNEADGVKIVFVGDTGGGQAFRRLFNLIRNEKTDLFVHLGDTDYGSGERYWQRLIERRLGNDPVLIAMGNHDYRDSNPKKVIALGLERLKKRPDVECSGAYGEMMTCQFRGMYLVFLGVGMDGRPREDHEAYLSQQLAAAPPGSWRGCVWHANQHNMQAGGKNDETGWNIYEICRKHGAFIATAHEHSYMRTYALTEMESLSMADQPRDQMILREGVSFAFVSGLGGGSIRDQENFQKHFAQVYTKDQYAKPGALFGIFKKDEAHFYFKDVTGKIVDDFTVKREY